MAGVGRDDAGLCFRLMALFGPISFVPLIPGVELGLDLDVLAQLLMCLAFGQVIVW